ncbi:uncharacterized protein LOC120641948 isoform X9 [Panicum virgatum]|uniref:uncharacterized protein LOC120641948 isoform X9 n=1 Tax=Panicum virgatum TaxID=38727 RepID=UPI0019D64E61|nr:uncharacterized protein LOC120641948 isoform X9 [Panicum virgatum]
MRRASKKSSSSAATASAGSLGLHPRPAIHTVPAAATSTAPLLPGLRLLILVRFLNHSWCKGASIGWHSDDNKPNLRHRAFTDKLWLLLSNLEDWKKQLRKLLDVTMVTDSHGSFTASSPALGWRAAAASSPSSSAAGAAGQRAACPAAGACSPKKQRAAGAAGQQRGHAAHGGMRELRRRRAASSSRRQFRDRAGTVAMAATAVGERPVELDDEGNESDGKKSSPQISNTRR